MAKKTTAVNHFMNSILYKLEMDMNVIKENNPALYELYLDCVNMEQQLLIDAHYDGSHSSIPNYNLSKDYYQENFKLQENGI
jgi:hypothetical protein